MSKPTNSAARNQMTEWERQCYDWGWEDAEERIIKLLNIWDCNNDRCDCDSIDDCVYRQQLIALIKGEQK